MLTRSELEAVAKLAERYDLLVISDEVHADLSVAGNTHIPFASLSTDLEARTVTLYSASKAYNLGGMRCAVAHIGPAETQRRLAAMPSHFLGSAGMAAVAATVAAWTPAGDAWLERCLVRLRGNRERLAGWLKTEGAAAGVKGHPPEGTYLSWLDFRPSALGDDPASWLLAHARVMLSAGLSSARRRRLRPAQLRHHPGPSRRNTPGSGDDGSPGRPPARPRRLAPMAEAAAA